MTNHRIELTLTDEQQTRLANEQARSGRSPEHVASLAIDEYFARRFPDGGPLTAEACAAAWRNAAGSMPDFTIPPRENAYLSYELLDRIDAISHQSGRSLIEIVRDALDAWDRVHG